ncbi:MAG TPA: hypothetical protein VGG19_17685 [Tepidisphaeraceae bacterium]
MLIVSEPVQVVEEPLKPLVRGEVVHETVPGVTIAVIATGSPTLKKLSPEVAVPLTQYC